MGKRSGAFLVLALLLVPMAARAQKPGGNVWTRSAEVYLDQALRSTNNVDKTRFFNQAMEQARQATQKDPNNALGWQILGKTYAAMGDAARADSMLDKAETLYPGFTKDDAPIREQGWVDAYNAGVRALQANKIDEAIQHLEMADQIYQGRPSARMTLASIYLNKGDYDKAAVEYKGALAILDGPAGKDLKPDQQKQWQENRQKTIERLGQLYMFTKKFGDAVQLFQQQLATNPNDATVKLNLARAQALNGDTAAAKATFVDIATTPGHSSDDYSEVGSALFRARDFANAETAFRTALKVNPYNTEALYNLAQVLIVQLAPLDEQLEKATPATRPGIVAKIQPLTQELKSLADKYLESQPASASGLTLLAQGARIETDLATDPAAKTAAAKRALAILERRDSLRFEVSDAQFADAGDAGMKLTGTITNHRLAAGSPITFTVHFLGKDGSVVESQPVTVNAPAKDETAEFTATTKSKDVVGWKYEVAK